MILIAVAAMLLPGTDPVSMLIEMVPLLLLYEISIWVATWFGGAVEPAEDRPGEGSADRSAETGAAVR